MVKYRVLTPYELEQLEPHFVKFLAFQGIEADRWDKMKQNNDYQVFDIIDQFSDFVYDVAIEKITYIKITTPKDLRELHCEKEGVKVYGMEVADDSPIDLTDPKYLEKIFEGELTEGISIYSAEAPYKGTRDYYIFEQLEIGFRASDGKLFELLKQLKST